MNINGYEIKPFANLRDSNLRYANLRDSNLRYANLQCANLRDSNLRYANLQCANLQCANLRDSNLRYANLQCANLEDANLEDANLEGANLYGANLYGANLYGANLRGANLGDANLKGANLKGAKLSDFQIVPQEGSFIAYKKVNTGVIKLLIPEDAQRTSTLVGRKCRASYVKVLEGSGVSLTYLTKLEYKEGEFVYPDKYDDDIRVECTHGIHFFMNKKEAENW